MPTTRDPTSPRPLRCATISYGSIEVPDLAAELREAKEFACRADLEKAVYFAPRHEVVHGKTGEAPSA
jgi:hypothetical protein